MQLGVQDRARREIAISGVVQGVGFRPFVFGLASRLGLHGFVKNRQGGVLIEVEGAAPALDRFLVELEKGPPLARIDALTWAPRPPRGDRVFQIEASEAGGPSPVFISPDIATCDDCLRELFDPSDRRYLYPFLNCTNCGPRLTIVRGAPYDRERTTMAPFAMCRDCRAEYEDPRDRRFHAQPVACPACGPRLRALDAGGSEISGEPIAWAAAQLRGGQTGAIKGIGGWHLACDARNQAAVAGLRARKHRDEKPFALMVRDLAAAEELCEISLAERALLSSPARPIVLLRKRPSAQLSAAIAPHNPLLGVMLPYAPLHHLLLRAVEGTPLVMTSGNLSDEPIAFDDGDALGRLCGLAAFFLAHDRKIQSRCDDSVVRVVGEANVHVRRSRGYAPLPVRLPAPVLRPTLALGGELKATFALADGENCFLSHHLGDLAYAEAFRAYRASIAQYEELYRIAPRRIVHDLHPDYASTRYALERADREGVELLAVQHHHAHMASCMAENGLRGPALGVCFDGMGFGTDGTVWGGELLLGDCARAERVAHLSVAPMPGGEQATREPWRMAVAHLRAAGEELGPIAARVPAPALRAVDRMIERRFNSPLTSSMGRLFDAVAALAGVCDAVSFEGQAAIRLESLAATAAPDGAYPFAFDGAAIDVRPLVVAVARDVQRGASQALVARRFHSTVVELTLQACERVRAQSGVQDVVLSGGVFLNAILLREMCDGLAARGFRAFRHRLVPPSDGGLSLGQLAVAAARDGRPLSKE